MYDIPYFKAENLAQLLAFMRGHPFITLCGLDKEGKAVATHLPVLIEERESGIYLLGHFMRDTDHYQAFLNNPDVLAIFHGPNAYISASWYSNPNQASTWNYMVVHAKGFLQLTDGAALTDILEKTTAYFERDEDSPALVHKMPVSYVERLSKFIVGFEIKVVHLQNVFKLSQNKPRQDFEQIIQYLKAEANNGKAVALEMEKIKAQLFDTNK